MIDDYFRALEEILAASPAVSVPEMTLSKRSTHIGYVRGDVYFSDGSLLHFREFVNTQPVVERYTYVYHYQRADGQFVFRYDNTAHYPELPGAPHHKHHGSETNIVSASPPDLASVLREIEGLIEARA